MPNVLKFKSLACVDFNKMILQVFPHEKLLNNGKKILETKMIYLVIKFELKLLGFL
jgi:hypothetical protein